MFKSVIFDLDGVLVDSESVNIRAMTQTFGDLGIPLTEKEINSIPGRSSYDTIPLFLGARRFPSEEYQGVIQTNLQNYDALWDAEIKLMPGTGEVLHLLRSWGVSLAIGTTNRRSVIDRFVSRFGFENIFQCVVSGESVIKKKPDPEVYLVAAKQLGMPSDSILVVEDTEVGVLAAKNAGLACAAIPNQYSGRHDFSRADFVFSSLRNILRLF